MKREDRLIREMATECYEHLRKEGALGFPEPHNFVIRILRKSIRKAYKTGQESVQVPEPVAFLDTADPIRNEFVQFLRKQKVLKQFLENYERYNKKPFNVNDYLGDRVEGWADSAIYACFLWSGTPEGVDFWSEVCSKWREHHRKLLPLD